MLHQSRLSKKKQFIEEDGSIFVGIPSYRDSLINDTIESLMKNAEMPNRVFIHVFLQHDLECQTDRDTYE